jgi:hypothetical protein
MADVGVVSSTTYGESDTGILVEHLDNGSDILWGARLNDTCWVYTTQCGRPVLLRLVLILEGKKPRSQYLARKCILNVGAGVASDLPAPSRKAARVKDREGAILLG